MSVKHRRRRHGRAPETALARAARDFRAALDAGVQEAIEHAKEIRRDRAALDSLHAAHGRCSCCGRKVKALIAVHQPDGTYTAVCTPDFVKGCNTNFAVRRAA